MFLTAAQREHFLTEGYLVLPHFWDSQETRAIQAEIARLQHDGLLHNVATDDDGKTASQTKQNLQLVPIFNKSDFIRALPYAPKVAETVAQLIGEPILLHLDQVFLKPARSGSGTNWHTDNSYFQLSDPLKGTAMWTAVHDATIANGTIHLIPKSFQQTYPHSRDPESNHHIRCYPPEEQARPIELPAGGVVFFAYGMAHSTKANTTAKDRAGLAFHFRNAHYPAAPLGPGTTKTYLSVLTGPDATGGEREYGVRVAGTWEEQVAQILARQVASGSATNL